METEVTDDDGLEIRNVKLAGRFMAHKINLPYYKLSLRGLPEARCELKPNQRGEACRSRLVAFETRPSQSMLVISATYEVTNVPRRSKNCLRVAQQYEFHATQLGCEPSESLPCAPFKPIVKYLFSGRARDFASVNTVQRLQFQVDGLAINAVGVFEDCTIASLVAGQCLPPFFSFQKRMNPVLTEMADSAIVMGGEGEWDNFHQTFEEEVSEPILPPFLPIPGCPKCVHIHWRWSNLIGDPQFGGGRPIIPPGSSQTVDFAITAFSELEEDPADYRALVNGQPVKDMSPVLWYSAKSMRTSDAFFTHGGFFKPTP